MVKVKVRYYVCPNCRTRVEEEIGKATTGMITCPKCNRKISYSQEQKLDVDWYNFLYILCGAIAFYVLLSFLLNKILPQSWVDSDSPWKGDNGYIVSSAKIFLVLAVGVVIFLNRIITVWTLDKFRFFLYLIVPAVAGIYCIFSSLTANKGIPGEHPNHFLEFPGLFLPGVIIVSLLIAHALWGALEQIRISFSKK